jgi:hypothetical protein
MVDVDAPKYNRTVMENGEREVEKRHCKRALTREWIDRVGAWRKKLDAPPPLPPQDAAVSSCGEGAFVA